MRNKTALVEGGATIWARQTIDSDIFFAKPHSWFKIWFYLVNKTNHQDNGRFKRGECFVQYPIICELTGAKRNEVKRCMSWLKKRGSISTRRSTRGVNIILTNYDYYQTLENYEYKKMSPEKAPDKSPKEHQNSTFKAPAIISDKQEWKNQEINNKEGNTLGPSGLGLDVFNPKNNITNCFFESEVKESAGARLNRAIWFFEPIFPGEFAGKNNALVKTTTRDVVEAMLKRYTLSDLKELIRLYGVKRGDRFRPQAHSIWEFCTTKLAVIETYFYQLCADGDPYGEREELCDSCFGPEYEEAIKMGIDEGELSDRAWEISHNRPWMKEIKS